MANIMKKNSGSRLKKEKKPRLPLSVWLAFLLVVTLTVGGSLARYSSSASGSSDARVAKFQMTTEVTSTDTTIELDATDASISGTYSFTVSNESEVVVKYKVIVKNVPAHVKVDLGTDSQISDGSGDLVFTLPAELAIGATDTCTLTFTAMNDADAIEAADVTVQIDTVQVN